MFIHIGTDYIEQLGIGRRRTEVFGFGRLQRRVSCQRNEKDRQKKAAYRRLPLSIFDSPHDQSKTPRPKQN